MEKVGAVISATIPTSTPGNGKELSASGFILDVQRGFVMTTASWLQHAISIHPPTVSLDTTPAWSLCPCARFQVLLAGSRGSEWLEAQVEGVYFVNQVYKTLVDFVSSCNDSSAMLSHDQKQASDNIVYLSSAVLLRVNIPTQYSYPQLTISSSTALTPGHPLVLVHTPFGSLFPDAFLNSLSQGCLTNHCDSGVFLTDVRCVDGSQGGLVVDGCQKSGIGMIVSLVADLTGAAIGMSFCVSLTTVLQSISPHIPLPNSLMPKTGHCVSNHSSPVRSVVMVTSGTSWASGVVLLDDIILTCSHVILNHDDVAVRAWSGGVAYPARVLYASPPSVAPDIAVLKLINRSHHTTPLSPSREEMMSLAKSSDLHTRGEEIGSDVMAIGYCLQGPSSSSILKEGTGPIVTRGVIAKLVKGHLGTDEPVSVVMVQSTAGVYNGMSGGLLWSCQHHVPVGVLVSHAREDSTGLAHPNVSFALPLSWLCIPLAEFLTTKSEVAIERIVTEEVSQLWQLQSHHKQPVTLFSRL